MHVLNAYFTNPLPAPHQGHSLHRLHLSWRALKAASFCIRSVLGFCIRLQTLPASVPCSGCRASHNTFTSRTAWQYQINLPGYAPCDLNTSSWWFVLPSCRLGATTTGCCVLHHRGAGLLLEILAALLHLKQDMRASLADALQNSMHCLQVANMEHW